MKKIVINLTIIFFVLCISFISANNFSFVVNAKTLQNENKITVNGTGEITLIPDVAIIEVGVDSINKKLELAEKDNSEKINKVINILTANGIKEEDIKTTYFSVFQKYEYSPNKVFEGYQITNRITFKTYNLDGVGNLVSRLIESGTNVVNGVNFTIEDKEAAYNLALAKAITNAKSKALSLLGNSVNLNIVEIVEDGSMHYPVYDTYSTMKASNSGESILKGEATVKASIRVVFEF
jgi:uncharacterized protein YggE